MRETLIILFLIQTFSLFAQDNSEYIDEPNLVETKNVLFSKNSWEPFNGNSIYYDQNSKLTYKNRIKNGIAYYTEVYNENNSLNYVIDNGNYLDSENTLLKSKFNDNEKFQDSNQYQRVNIIIRFHEDYKTGTKTKANGIFKFDFNKIHFSNGGIIKLEIFYDEECERIKESYEIFNTDLGNVFDEEVGEIHHGKYELWSDDGKLAETGKYEMGKKTN
ncbi:hypothetical protein [Winogradskyella forsetii]|uniref:hypothetical protein n=1 Tax=Winogradskyella forsetii TaxID=2686077 RepID=UPI0015BE467D|nr:hypothetical protein [Winogradskyella forsetii]